MNIITAKEARRQTERYVSRFIEPTVDYVMKTIEETSHIGVSFVVFSHNSSTPYFESMKTDEFAKFMKKFGYKYDYTTQEYRGKHEEEIKISW